MTDAVHVGVVVDTMVVSWLFDDRLNPLADRYRELIGASPVLLAFQTVAELRYGALRADLRDSCRRIGHPLEGKVHDGDRWIAATAIRLRLPLVSHDGMFDATPGLRLLTSPTAL